ncbi:cupin domain-containing protein [Rhodanobacter sp. DHG33]|uniref:cupin domain-containing protein n=1 Tax=Rhodanobacter sp. DHG33 TaxID=2775921 RepID=UPI00178361F7|nr:cupin domain-containing protein [Rhodanobacter sp. DHG33]MBD8898773.1 cupin domain-containing protein [Rhodanobacter sp. DHG33]
MSKPVLNIDELEAIPLEVLNKQHGGNPMPAKFGGAMAPIGQRLGAQKLGYNLTTVPPGKRAFPFHSHRVNEEMFFVIEGSGEVRIGSETWPVRTGDVICCPPGGPETAHQIVNTGDATLRYLAVSSSQTPEICEYPDSGKFAVMHFAGKDADGKPQGFRHAGRLSDGCDYWDGE